MEIREPAADFLLRMSEPQVVEVLYVAENELVVLATSHIRGESSCAELRVDNVNLVHSTVGRTSMKSPIAQT